MIRRIGARVAWGIAVLWAVITLTFVIDEVPPSDPARMVAGPAARPADVAKIRVQLGLDRPVLDRYGSFMRRLVHGAAADEGATADAAHASCATFGPIHVDLGKSYQQRRAVTTILGERMGPTVMLACAALLVQLAIGFGFGIAAAIKRGTKWDTLAVTASLVGVSVPTFVVGLSLQFVLALELHLLPLDGFGKTPFDQARAIVLPAITFGLLGASYYARLIRGELVSALGQDYARTARAKGASEWRVVVHHALRSALVPAVTVIGLDLGGMFGGAVVTETLFRWPGLGSLSVTAMLDRDTPVVIGVVLLASTAVVGATVLADVGVALLDPRVRRAPITPAE